MHFLRSSRGPLLALILAALAVAVVIAGCAGVVASTTPPSSPAAPTPAAAQLSVSPSAVSLDTTVGGTGSQTVTASNSGGVNLTVSNVQVSGTGFAVSGLSTPISLSPGQSQTLTITFDATSSGTVSGALSLVTNASTSPVVVPLEANAAAAVAPVTSITISPASPTAIVNSTIPFSATVLGSTTNKAVAWKAHAGKITSAGVYTALAAPGTDIVTATSVADATKSKSTTVYSVAAPSTPVVTSVAITPSSATPAASAKIQFTASVQGTVTDKSVTWKASSGTITSAGLYTAPAAASSATVTATSNADKTKSASAAITISAPASPPVVSSVTVSPSPASTSTGGTLQFSATVAGTVTDKSVAWKAHAGKITAAGIYTAPAAAQTDIVTATSNADPTKFNHSTVTVSAASATVTGVTVSPTPVSVGTSGTQQFTATVAGTTTNKSVAWKATRGTISSSGAYTAPGTAGSDTVTATSVANAAKSASAAVTVAAAIVTSVAISPSSTSTTTGSSLTFKATVNGTVSDKAVTWKANLGTISAGGVYAAPSKAGTDTVTATSDADTAKSGTATVTVSAPSSGPLAAFPGAQGGGAPSLGGRGGKVMEVTTLADSGAGSLRACIEASGARNCVFRVAGIISPQSMLKVMNPFLTIACQTAPGEVIIGGPKIAGDALFITTHDVIVRYCTFSADNPNIAAGPDTGTMNIEIANNNNYNIIFDHVTTRWAGNKLWLALSNYVGPNHGITTQWSMFYEPHAAHPVGPGTGTNPGCSATASSPCFSASEKDIDFHHNMFANMSHRIPESTNYSTRWINNIVYNWQYYASEWLGAMHVDEIGNKYVAGNLNPAAQKHEIHFTTNSPPLPGNPSVYLSGNIGPNQSDPSGNQYNLAAQISGENGNEQGAIPSSWIRTAPMAGTPIPIAADSVSNLDSVLLPTIGNSQHLDCSGNWVSHRDNADTRVINQYKNKGSGGFWPNGITDAGATSVPTPSSGWTDQPVTNFSACTESQHDGIPDAWKSARGLSTTDPNLHSEMAPNGYTWLENYMNGPAGAAGSSSLIDPAARLPWAFANPAATPGSASVAWRRSISVNGSVNSSSPGASTTFVASGKRAH
jgi:hypothetical protein